MTEDEERLIEVTAETEHLKVERDRWRIAYRSADTERDRFRAAYELALEHLHEAQSEIERLRQLKVDELDGRILAWDRAKNGQRWESVGPVEDDL